MALGDGAVTVNPTLGLVTPKCKPAGVKRVISGEDIIRAQMVLEIRERLMFRLCCREGLRPGEAMALQVGDCVDGVIHIRRRIYRGDVDTPKTERSKRPIPMTEATATLLKAWIEMIPDTSAAAWLFPSETGVTPLSYSNAYRRRIGPALKKVGLAGVNFQVLRRTWVTDLAEVEKDPKIRAQLAGHSVDVHENEYRQPRIADLKEAMEKLDKRRVQ